MHNYHSPYTFYSLDKGVFYTRGGGYANRRCFVSLKAQRKRLCQTQANWPIDWALFNPKADPHSGTTQRISENNTTVSAFKDAKWMFFYAVSNWMRLDLKSRIVYFLLLQAGLGDLRHFAFFLL